MRKATGCLVILLGCAPQIGGDDPEIDPGPGDAQAPVAPHAGTDAGAGGAPPPTGTDGGAAPVPLPPVTTPYQPPRVVISELMYHPAHEQAAVETHEFVEIANRTDAAVPIGGWKLAGAVTYAFPKGTTLAPKQHLVVAKNPEALVRVWGLKAAEVVGPFDGELDNGGERLGLLDEAGALVDSVAYDDAFPWPMGGDAFGVGGRWLPAALQPERHQHKGHSIERISYEISGDEPVNWTTSPLDASTPARSNTAAGKLEAIVERIGHQVAAKDVLVRASLSSRGVAVNPTVEYFVDDVNRDDATETRTKVAMTRGAQGWEATIPALPAGAPSGIVRYRVLGDRGDGRQVVIGPRATDPFAWWAYHAGPAIDGKTPAYQIFISRKDWSQMYANIAAGRVPGGKCDPNPTWNSRVPATLVHDGRVHDVRVRYQGSPYSRRWGPMLTRPFPADQGPTDTPAQAYGWHIWLPRYERLANGRSEILLSKRASECNFITTAVGAAVFESVGIPAPRVEFGRLFVNGFYYHFFTEIEHPDEDMLKRHFGKGHEVGDYFKASGWNGEQGPYTWADFRDLGVKSCTKFTPAQLYGFNYDRAAPDYKEGADEVMALVKDFTAARAAGPEAVRKHLNDTFDVPLLVTYLAAMNWMGPWDDFFQNHFLYRRKDGKWMYTPWDFDNLFGGFVKASGSFYIGELGDRSNRVVGVPWSNHHKDQFFKTFRTEFHARLKELAAKELSSATIQAHLDKILAKYFIEEAQGSASNAFCNPRAIVDRVKSFTRDRNARVAAGTFN